MLDDVRWRGDFLGACEHEGKSLLAIRYEILHGDAGSDGIVVDAIFVDEVFQKFVPWESERRLGIAKDDPQGVYLSVPQPRHLSDSRWLIRHAEQQPLGIDDLKARLKSMPRAPHDADIGLTVAWLLLQPPLRGVSAENLKRNAELRDQFNAARLRIGMTAPEVRVTLKAEPLESGKAGSGSYEIYGSNESFELAFNHFSNILVVFREGKATVIVSAEAGHNWRQTLSTWFTDLPAPPRDR